MCAHTLLLNSIIHFTFVVEKQDTYQYMDKEFSNIRIVDIAKMAGVSVGTVDRVIHNRGRVSEENRKKVQTILEMVHYQPNLMPTNEPSDSADNETSPDYSGDGSLSAESDGSFVGI